MVYYVPFIMSRVTFAWAGNIVIQFPQLLTAFCCLLNPHVVQLKELWAGERGFKSGSASPL